MFLKEHLKPIDSDYSYPVHDVSITNVPMTESMDRRIKLIKRILK